MIDLLIVSKNRPCQLDLFLRSVLKNFLIPYKATILYTYSDDFYKKGYDIILDLYKNKFNFVKESNFKQDVLRSLNKNNKYFTSLGDDTLIIGKIELTKEFEIFNRDVSILAINYRMGPNIEVVFEGDPTQNLPNFTSEMVWNWQVAKKNWHTSMAMMGQFYRMSDMIDYLPTLGFNNPTSLEGCMNGKPFNNKPFMVCFEESKIIELVVNRVQTVSLTNRFGNITTGFLNEVWLAGKRIKIEPLYNLPKNINRYFYVDFEYENI